MLNEKHDDLIRLKERERNEIVHWDPLQNSSLSNSGLFSSGFLKGLEEDSIWKDNGDSHNLCQSIDTSQSSQLLEFSINSSNIDKNANILRDLNSNDLGLRNNWTIK